MTIPAFFLGFIIATLYGALFHLWRGGGPKRIFLYFLLAWMGFFGAHFLALWLGWVLLPIGTLNFGIATIGALIFLFAGDWLGRIEPS